MTPGDKLFVLFGADVLYCKMRVVLEDATPPLVEWRQGDGMRSPRSLSLLFQSEYLQAALFRGAAFIMLWGGESLWKNRK